jgi:hypothetical protein
MGSVVLARSTPYYGISGLDGLMAIHSIPPGSYRLHAWSETAELVDSEVAKRVTRVAAEPINLGQITLKLTTVPTKQHMNKFEEDYLAGHPPSY